MTNTSICPTCGEELGESAFPEDWDAVPAHVCALCQHLAHQNPYVAEQVRHWLGDQRANMPSLVEFPPRLLRCVTREGIPSAIWDLVPKTFLANLYEGQIPSIGIGFNGPAGSRKSGTLAWLAQCLNHFTAHRMAGTWSRPPPYRWSPDHPATAGGWESARWLDCVTCLFHPCPGLRLKLCIRAYRRQSMAAGMTIGSISSWPASGQQSGLAMTKWF